MTRVLVIDDDARFASGMQRSLQAEGYEVDLALDGAAGLAAATAAPPNLILLDLLLPAIPGYVVLQRLRAAGIAAPVMVVSGLHDEPAKVLGLDLGADDFVVKPCGLAELLARVRALLRRGTTAEPDVAGTIAIGDLAITPALRRVCRDGRDVPLRPKEYELLMALVRHRGRLVTRAQLLREIWARSPGLASRTVDTHIFELRRKLEDNPLRPVHIVTVRGSGYRLQDR